MVFGIICFYYLQDAFLKIPTWIFETFTWLKSLCQTLFQFVYNRWTNPKDKTDFLFRKWALKKFRVEWGLKQNEETSLNINTLNIWKYDWTLIQIFYINITCHNKIEILMLTFSSDSSLTSLSPSHFSADLKNKLYIFL